MPAKASKRPQRVLVVTGLSGAGKTITLKAFEDMGFEAVDNLPLSLLMRLLRTEEGETDHPPDRPIAVGVDSRTRAFSAEAFLAQVAVLSKRRDLDLTLIFLDCGDAALSKRFSETRRRHPLAKDRPVRDGIQREREIMAPVKMRADAVIDTTGLTIHDLKRRLESLRGRQSGGALALNVMSFGFSHGVPRDADLVFDVRFLRNPNYVADLKPLTGREESVAAYVAGDEHFTDFFDKLSALVTFLLPLYRSEGKSYLTIAFGCTGGRHRSVFLAELLGRALEERGYRANILHRDLGSATD